MKPSPLHLTDYFITELHFVANAKFDPKQEVKIQPDDFQIAVEAQPAKDDNHRWQVVLKLQHQPAAEANVPCRLTIEIVGSFVVLDGVPNEHINRLVQTNGPSILYGIMREVVRDTSARGPYPPVMLPSTSFYKAEAKPAAPTVQAPAGGMPPAPLTVADASAPSPPAPGAEVPGGNMEAPAEPTPKPLVRTRLVKEKSSKPGGEVTTKGKQALPPD